MNKNVLIFSCEPGGAEVLIPVVDLLKKEPGIAVTVLSYGHGLARFKARGVACVETTAERAAAPTFLDEYSPSLVLTSATSLPQKDMSEKIIWRNARARGIKTMAFLDQWQNYAQRFSGVSGEENLAYLPDLINCINKTALEEMAAEGFGRDILLPLGHPSLSSLRERAAASGRDEMRRKAGLPADKKMVVFVSEPIEEHYGLTRGYIQYSALEFFLENIYQAEASSFLVVKLHPKDDPNKYSTIVKKLNGAALVIQSELTPLETVVVADEVYGMSSIMLIEAFILGKPVISVQPGLKIADPLVLSRQGFIKRVTSEGDLLHSPSLRSSGEFQFAFKENEFLTLVRSLITPPGRE
jgi:hypothetical protein